MHSSDLKAIEWVVHQNTRCLTMTRKAFAKDCGVPWSPDEDAPSPEWVSFRSMARAFCLEGRAWELRGEPGKAAGSYLDAMRLGSEVSRDGLVLNALVGAAAQGYGMRGLEGIIPRLGAAQSRDCLLRLQRVSTRSVAAQQILHNERLWITAVMARPGMKEEIIASSGFSGMERIRLYLSSTREAVGQLDRYMRGCEEYAAAPVYRRRPWPQEPTNALALIVIPVYSRVVYSLDDRDAKLLLLRIMLACRIYQCDHGSAPTTLSALVPKYLPQIPPDPYSGKDLIYKPKGSAYLLYSVGPDGKDDGGALFNRQTREGDLVAGSLYP